MENYISFEKMTLKEIIDKLIEVAELNPKRRGGFETKAESFNDIIKSQAPIFFDLYTIGRILSKWNNNITWNVSTRGTYLDILLNNYKVLSLKAKRRRVKLGHIYDYVVCNIELQDIESPEILNKTSNQI